MTMTIIRGQKLKKPTKDDDEEENEVLNLDVEIEDYNNCCRGSSPPPTEETESEDDEDDINNNNDDDDNEKRAKEQYNQQQQKQILQPPLPPPSQQPLIPLSNCSKKKNNINQKSTWRRIPQQQQLLLLVFLLTTSSFLFGAANAAWGTPAAGSDKQQPGSDNNNNNNNNNNSGDGGASTTTTTTTSSSNTSSSSSSSSSSPSGNNNNNNSSNSNNSSNNNSNNNNSDGGLPKRVKHLDYWNAETMASFLGIDRNTFQPLPTTAAASSLNFKNDNVENDVGRLVDTYAGYDAAVLFYAQWCQNCHALAPLWAQLAELSKAGTTESNMIMSLFDCEKNREHTRLCTAAGITHYPTLLYVGAGPYRDGPLFPISMIKSNNRAQQDVAAAPLRRTAKFRGDWRYGEAIMDWMSLMKGLSDWHKFSRGSNPIMRFWRGLFRPFWFWMGYGGGGGKKNNQKGSAGKDLPVGVPQQHRVVNSGGGGSPPTSSSSSSSSSNINSDESATTTTTSPLSDGAAGGRDMEQELKDTLQTVKHSNLLLDSTLLPQSLIDSSGGVNDDQNVDNETTATTDPSQPDLFVEITRYDYWNPSTLSNVADNNYGNILRTCMMDLSLDYCSRISSKIGESPSLNKQVDVILTKHPDNVDDALNEITTLLKNKVREVEPFCAVFDKCLEDDFVTNIDVCQPSTCPFVNDVACKYLSSCLIPSIQQEYADLFSSSGDIDA